MKELKDQLSNLIENNKIDQAIKILKEESAKRDGSLDHFIISLSSRYKRYRDNSLMGLEARDQEFTKIVSDTLILVQKLDDPSSITHSDSFDSPSAPSYTPRASYSNPSASSTQQSNKNKYMQMGIGGLAVIGLIAIIGIFMGEDESANAGYDDSGAYQETYMESDMSGGGAGYSAYDVSGHWRQASQNFGPDYDCPDCTIDISQDGNYVSVISNSGMSAQLEFISQSGLFEGMLSWGSPDVPDQAVQIYFDESTGYLVLNTMIEGTAYIIYYGL